MEKEKLMQKLKIKDYNKELEEILLNKTFSKTTKNLLSSMLYKIENSYEDYKKTKVEVISKKEFLEELIEIISKNCMEIEIIKPNLEEENKILNGKKSIVIKEEQKIITYQNELALMQAIYDLNTNKFKEADNSELKEKAVFTVLSEGEKTSRSEIIRDFDGWSWNVLTEEIDDYIPNLIYQCLVYLIGYDKLNKNSKTEDLETILKEQYKTSLAEKILKTIIQLSIINYIKKNPDENKELKNIEEQLQKNLLLMEDKKTYIEEITKQKKEYIKEIENIDKYINDDLKLKKEYIKQNEKLPQDQRVFSLSDFSEKTENRRKFLENELKELTEKLKPKNFVKEKNELEKEINFVKELRVENEKSAIKDFIDLVLKAINTQIEKIENKKEAVDKIYILRYLKLLNIDSKDNVGTLNKKQFEKVEKNLITTACNLKAINIFSKDVEENYKIYKNIFNTKIIDLESAYIEINKENMVQIYDDNSLEKEEKFTEFKELAVKYNKKIKMFL